MVVEYVLPGVGALVVFAAADYKTSKEIRDITDRSLNVTNPDYVVLFRDVKSRKIIGPLTGLFTWIAKEQCKKSIDKHMKDRGMVIPE